MTKLGDHTIVLSKSVDDWTATDDYGNPARGKVYREIRWCSLTPARPSEDQSRTGPAIVGATLLAPPKTARDIEGADEILSDWTKRADGTYTGRRWEVLGEVGQWDDAVEALLRRLV